MTSLCYCLLWYNGPSFNGVYLYRISHFVRIAIYCSFVHHNWRWMTDWPGYHMYEHTRAISCRILTTPPYPIDRAHTFIYIGKLKVNDLLFYVSSALVEYLWGNSKYLFAFSTFRDRDSEIISRVCQGGSYSAYSIPWLLVPRWYKEPGIKQPYYSGFAIIGVKLVESHAYVMQSQIIYFDPLWIFLNIISFPSFIIWIWLTPLIIYIFHGHSYMRVSDFMLKVLIKLRSHNSCSIHLRKTATGFIAPISIMIGKRFYCTCYRITTPKVTDAKNSSTVYINS